MATKIETDLLGNFSSFTGVTIGTAGSANSWSYFFAMETILRAQKAPYPYFYVCHPYQCYPLSKAASVAGTRTNASNNFLDELRQSMFFVHQVGGVFIYTSANISIDGSGDAVSGMFSRDALALDVRTAPYIEPERNASRRGWELNMSSTYGHGVWRPTFGVKGTFDATAPDGTS